MLATCVFLLLLSNAQSRPPVLGVVTNQNQLIQPGSVSHPLHDGPTTFNAFLQGAIRFRQMSRSPKHGFPFESDGLSQFCIISSSYTYFVRLLVDGMVRQSTTFPDSSVASPGRANAKRRWGGLLVPWSACTLQCADSASVVATASNSRTFVSL